MAKLDNDDLKAIKNLIDESLDEKLDQKLDEKLSHLPSKEDFYTKMDEVVGELKTIREEHPILSNKVSNHSNRIENIEEKLGIQASD